MRKISFTALALLIIFTVSCTKRNIQTESSTKTKESVQAQTVKENTLNYPQRIVALSPSAGEILFAVGAEEQVAAVSEFTDYPPEAASKPVVGGFDGKTLSMESILGFKPDFLYLTDGMHNFLIEQLDSYGIKYYISKGDSIKAVMQEILDIGMLTGHAEKAAEIVQDMTKKIGGIKKADSSSLYYEVWNAPFMTAGSRSFINDIIFTSGAENIFADIDEAYPIVSEETIIARQPEYILIPASCGITVEAVKARNGWASIPAVKNNKIFLIDDNVYTRPGPRVADVVVELNALLK
jgi:iron complex transport system substrate-binding protein